MGVPICIIPMTSSPITQVIANFLCFVVFVRNYTEFHSCPKEITTLSFSTNSTVIAFLFELFNTKYH